MFTEEWLYKVAIFDKRIVVILISIFTVVTTIGEIAWNCTDLYGLYWWPNYNLWVFMVLILYFMYHVVDHIYKMLLTNYREKKEKEIAKNKCIRFV